jgi:hypothetical protein
MNMRTTMTETTRTPEPISDSTIEIVEVTKQFRDNVVLHGISLDIPS